MIRRIKRRRRIKNLSKLGDKIANIEYNRDFLIQSRFKEVNESLDEYSKLTEEEIESLINTGLEPVAQVYGSSFLIFNFETYKYGIANFKIKKIIVPCEFSNMEFNKKDITVDGVLVNAINVFEETTKYLVKDTARIYSSIKDSKSTVINNIAKKHGFSDNINISNPTILNSDTSLSSSKHKDSSSNINISSVRISNDNIKFSSANNVNVDIYNRNTDNMNNNIDIPEAVKVVKEVI